MQTQKTKHLAVLAMLAAVSTLLYFIEIPFFPGTPLKIDFSDLPAALAAVLFGPAAGIAVEAVKNLLLFPRDWASDMGYGALMNFLVGTAMVVPLAIVARGLLKAGKKRARAVLTGGAAGLAAMVAVGVVANYFIAPPFFAQVMHFHLTAPVLWGYIGTATVLNVLKPVITTLLLLPVLAALGRNAHALRV